MDRPAVAYGLQENQRDEMHMVREKSPCLSTGGGRCGQGLPAIMIEEEDTSVLCVDQGGGKSGCGVTEEVSPTLACTHGGAPAVLCQAESSKKAYGVWQNGNSEVGIMDDTTCALTTGGGKPGQGYPCVLVEEQSDSEETQESDDTSASDEAYVAAFAYQQGAAMPSLPYGEKISPPLLSSQKTAVVIDNHPADSRVQISESGVCQTLSARMGTGGGNVPLVMETDVETTSEGSGEEKPLTMTCGCWSQCNEDKAATLAARDYKDPQIVVKPKSIVRRLTPLECERLQGFPDFWTASESDSARYKALGNSVALPCVDYIMSGVADVLDPIMEENEK